MTAQIRESLVFNGEKYYIASEPLYPYIVEHNLRFMATNTACWRGYRGSWTIEDNKLYLVELSGFLLEGNNRKNIDLKDIFPNQDKVFAEWFSGEIRIPYGEMLEYLHMGYMSVYEKEMFLKFESGVLVGSREIDNTKK